MACSDDQISIVAIHEVGVAVIPLLVERAMALLNSEWPAISIDARIQNLTSLRDGFALVVRLSGEVVGVVKLQTAKKTFRERVAYLSCFLIHTDYRRKGLGRRLYQELERRARDASFVRIYLKADNPDFFRSLGFCACPAPSEMANIPLLNADQHKSLEKVFQQRTSLLPESALWMTKAVIEERDLIRQDSGWWKCELARLCLSDSETFVHINGVPFSLQIGPSCGLAALRMAMQETDIELKFCVANGSIQTVAQQEIMQQIQSLMSAAAENEGQLDFGCVEVEPRPRSLLEAAIELKYTYLGEMFNAVHLARLGRIFAPDHRIELICKVISVSDIIQRVLKGGRILLAYDRSPADHQPIFVKGNNAHWAVIVGIIVKQSTEEIWFIAQHGMSQHPLIASANILLQSNRQLVGPLANADAFRIDDQGIRLADHFVCIYDKRGESKERS